MPKIVVLRLGHRYIRDSRLTTHLYLIARAFGASSMILADVVDNRLEEAVSKVGDRWGGDFTITMGVPWKKAINEWKEKGGIVCHLTMYGENIENGDALERIKESGRDIMVVVGGQKVPGEMFQLADFNIAIGGQPHSECAALAVLLDRYFEGKELLREFRNAKIRTVPQRHGKKVLESL